MTRAEEDARHIRLTEIGNGNSILYRCVGSNFIGRIKLLRRQAVKFKTFSRMASTWCKMEDLERFVADMEAFHADGKCTDQQLNDAMLFVAAEMAWRLGMTSAPPRGRIWEHITPK